MPRLLTLVCLGVLAQSCATPWPSPPVDAKPYIEVSARTSRLSCYGPQGGEPFGSRLGRGPVLAAPGGSRAYAEVIATATLWADGARDCRNLSRLYVARSGEPYRIAFEQNPGAEGTTGNSIELIDWAPDGRTLLMELTVWTYPTDVVNPLIVLYDTRTGEVRELPIDQLVKEKYPGKCFVELRALGFTPQGGVIASTAPLSRSFSFPAPSCTEDRVLWLYNESEEAIEALPGTYAVRRWGAREDER